MRGQDPDGDAEDSARVAEATQAAETPSARVGTAPEFSQTVVGWVTPESTTACLVVDFAGNPAGPLRARSTVRLDEPALGRAIATRQSAALVFENGDLGLPIVLGLLQEAPTPLHDLLRAEAPRPPAADAPRLAPIEASVDGKRVVIDAEHEITLKCGEASLTLRRDGKILLRGTYVETYARGLNRIKGAQVKIN